MDTSGPVALAGSGEFLPVMAAVDEELLESRPRRVAVIPTAAALEGPSRLSYWLDLARRHYDALGAETVEVPVVDRHDADDPELAARIAGVGLVYLSGGNPHHLSSTLRATRVWEAVLEQWNGGAALAGCSAGAMALTSGAPPGLRPASASDAPAGAGPRLGPGDGLEDEGAGVPTGLGVVDTLAVIPHYDQMERWLPGVEGRFSAWKPPGTVLVGIEEDTALVQAPPGWVVRGRQGVWVLDPGPRRRFTAGQAVDLP